MAEHDQQFDTFEEWVNKAKSWLTRRKRWESDNTFRAICFDAKGRYCYSGEQFMRARDERAFPVRWLWPEQIAFIGNDHPFFKPQAQRQDEEPGTGDERSQPVGQESDTHIDPASDEVDLKGVMP